MMNTTKLAACVTAILASTAAAGPKPADGVSGRWKGSYGEGDAKTPVTLVLGRHKTTVCGHYMPPDAGSAAGYLSLKLTGTAATGLWMESTSHYGKTELAFGGDKAKGGWAETPSDPKLIPLAVDYAGAVGVDPGKLTGKWEYKNSGGERCTMKLTQKGAIIEMTGTSSHDDSDCGKWTATLRGNMLVGEWTATSKESGTMNGNFYAIVGGEKAKPSWMTGMEGSQNTDGTPSCDNIGRINLSRMK